ncbi:hypothetical protein O9992_03395 [Vibrio lentus]|nr:hypothetical protein [Vibrio lentus]
MHSKCSSQCLFPVEQVKQVHDGEYVDLLVSGNLPAAKMRRIGFPWSEQLIEKNTLFKWWNL